MALFKLTIYDVCTDAEPTDTSTILTKSLLTDMQLVEINGYQYALVGLHMMKQMYQPILSLQTYLLLDDDLS